MAAAEVEQPSQPLKYKTWVLKVSIHCEACKKKVKKILQKVEGVYAIDIDTKQQKVVVTGNVEADALLKKLNKANKHAELWPVQVLQQQQSDHNQIQGEQKPAPKSRKEKKPNNNDQPPTSTTTQEPAAPHHPKEINPSTQPPATVHAIKAEPPAVRDSAKITTQLSEGVGGVGGGATGGGNGAGGGDKVAESVAKSAGGGGKVAVVEPNAEDIKKPGTVPTVNQASPPALETNGGESNTPIDAEKSDGGGGGGGGGGEGKKKKKKSGVHVVVSEPSPSASPESGLGSSAAPASGSPPNHINGVPLPATFPANQSLPRHHGYQFPPHYYAPPPPVYAVNYSVAQPSSTYTASYYASPPPYSYAHSYTGSGMEAATPASSDLDSYTANQPLDSFEMFSDENPNGCSVM